jgi:hypothetical protein
VGERVLRAKERAEIIVHVKCLRTRTSHSSHIPTIEKENRHAGTLTGRLAGSYVWKDHIRSLFISLR